MLGDDETFKVHDKSTNSAAARILPLELKTGKTTFSAEHKGQVTLYAMMCSERRPEVEAGILLYLKDLAMQTIPANYANKRGLIQLRNEMVFYLKHSTEQSTLVSEMECLNSSNHWPFGHLPAPISNERVCSGCPQLLACSLYQRTERGRSEHDGNVLSRLATEKLGHLSHNHLDYFRHWCLLMHLESAAEKRKDSESPAGIWMQTGSEREKSGSCISCLSLDVKQSRKLDVEKYLQVFIRHPVHSSSSEFTPLDAGLQVMDSIIVSAENKPLIAVATGSITHICGESVSLVTDRDLQRYTDHKDTVYRLDRCNTYSSLPVHLSNIARLMDNNPSSEKLRQLIVDRSAPQFELTMSRTAVEKVKDIFKSLNKPQKAAVLKVLMSKDYVLVKGYPGTGKTSTIVALIRILVQLGCSVLLASYTHSAVDNILLKLQKTEVDFLRIGRLERIHPSLRQYADEALTRDIASVDQLSNFYAAKKVVATTCLGVNHVLFVRRTFDVCIVDEASQVSLPACLGPLFHCRRFVLVGDPKQLPPVIQSREARVLGMDESLFVRLENSGATCELNVQYRMNSAIMRLSNELIYNGALQCADSVVSQARLQVATHQTANSGDRITSLWLDRCISNREGDEVLWLDTDPLLNGNVSYLSKLTSSSPVQNVIEASVIRYVVERLVNAGVTASDIGVVAPYQQQVRLIRETLKTMHAPDCIEVNTVDQYQGRDKSAIVISFVRTVHTANNTQMSPNEILTDERRLNVAVTRARHKLIFVGSTTSLTIYQPLRKLIGDILHSDQILPLHEFDPDMLPS